MLAKKPDFKGKLKEQAKNSKSRCGEFEFEVGNQ